MHILALLSSDNSHKFYFQWWNAEITNDIVWKYSIARFSRSKHTDFNDQFSFCWKAAIQINVAAWTLHFFCMILIMFCMFLLVYIECVLYVHYSVEEISSWLQLEVAEIQLSVSTVQRFLHHRGQRSCRPRRKTLIQMRWFFPFWNSSRCRWQWFENDLHAATPEML